jgi:hypothetical protein
VRLRRMSGSASQTFLIAVPRTRPRDAPVIELTNQQTSMALPLGGTARAALAVRAPASIKRFAQLTCGIKSDQISQISCSGG